MDTYKIRADYADETFEVFSVEAGSIVEAAEIVRRDPEVVFTTSLCRISRQPETFLAW